ncbi:MAG TPA: fibronectin type III domain-containing protein, partial [Verrucomicrobiae bacterium]
NFYPTYLRNTVLWPTIGNHDAYSAGATPYLNNFTLPQNAEAGGLPSGTENYYSFDYANIHLICLDSALSSRAIGGAMYLWAEADLQATTQDWIIAFFHHPPYTKGSHNSDVEGDLVEMRQNFNPLLEEHGVDLVLCGHSHGYERSFLLDGHYGGSTTFAETMKKDGGNGRTNGSGVYQKSLGTLAHQGTVYTVAGSSGQASSGSPYNHPAMYISMGVIGSTVIDVNSNRLDLTFLKADATAGDYFTILKTPAVLDTNPPAAPTALLATAVSSNRINLAWTDNAANEQGFKLERSTNGADFVEFITTGASVTSLPDIGLLPNKTYHYRIRAFNSSGDSAYSDTAQATTFAGPPPDLIVPAAITDLHIPLQPPSSSSRVLRWSAPGDDGNSGFNSGGTYDVRYSTSPINSNNWALATPATGEPSPSAPGTLESFTVPNLAPNQLYYFAMRTADEAANISELSNITNAMTLPAPDTTPPAAVTNLQVVGATSTSATLSWKAPGDDGNTGTAASYDVRYRTNAITSNNWSSSTLATGEPAPAVAGTTQSFAVTGLAAGRTYYFALRSADETTTNISELSN